MNVTAASTAIAVPQQKVIKPDLWEEALNTLSAEDRKEFVDSSTSPYEVLQKVHVTRIYSAMIDVHCSLNIMGDGSTCIPRPSVAYNFSCNTGHVRFRLPDFGIFFLIYSRRREEFCPPIKLSTSSRKLEICQDQA